MKNKKVIEFKGTVATLSSLTVTLRSNELGALKNDLRALCDDSPDFFNQDVAILDATALPGAGVDLDWTALVALLRTVRLNPVAVRHAAAEAEEKIRLAGLTLAEEIEIAPRKIADPAHEAPTLAPPPDTRSTKSAPAQPELDLASIKSADPLPSLEPLSDSIVSAPEAVKAPSSAAPPLAANVPPATTMVVDRPLRSGQQVYARNADLVVLAMVNPGAEVAADGNIHVYAPLRGRAMAGASGNMNARILTTCFEAELVSVGGVYRPLEPGMPKDVSGKPAQIRLADNAAGKQTLLIEPLKIV